MRNTLRTLHNELNVDLNTKASDAVSEMLSHTDKVTNIVLEMGKVVGRYNDCLITLSEAFSLYISLATRLHTEAADSPLGFMQLAYENLQADADKLEAFIASLN